MDSGSPANNCELAVFNRYIGVAVFALGRGANLAAHVVDDEVKSVADAQHGRVELEQFRVSGRRVGVVDRRGTAGEDDADGLVRLNFGKRRCARQDDGKDILFANAPRDQLRILRAEIEDNDCLGVHSLVWQGGGRDVKKLCGSATPPPTRARNSRVLPNCR